MEKPIDVHYKAALRVLNYLKQAPGQEILFTATSDFKVKGFIDSDWGSWVDTRRSATGYCFYLGLTLISWKSKKQPMVSKSSSEAEYRGMAQATCEAQWIVYLLKDLEVPIASPIVLFGDKQSAIYITQPSFP